MSGEVGALEAEVKEYKLQLETVQLGLQNDPENSELQSLKSELEEVITLTESTIAELKPPSAPAPKSSKNQPSAPGLLPVKEKWSKENHPAYQAGYRKPEVDTAVEEAPLQQAAPATFSVNDTVLARWKSGDGAFYNARITSITGSSSNPVYIVNFKNYGTTETIYAKDIKPLPSESRKRKADGSVSAGTSSSATAALPTPPPPPPSASSSTSYSNSNPNVISAAASVDPAALLASAAGAQQRREPSKVSDGPVRPAKVPRKVKANKELEAGKAKWQDFAAKGKFGKSAGKKESMFRTGESVNARVGFTGSGHEMRKDPSRSRHIYQEGAGEE